MKMKEKIRNPNHKKSAQVTAEFTFCFIMVLLLFYGCVMAFRWAGASLAARRVAHDSTLTQYVPTFPGWRNEESGPLKQLNPYFYEPPKMNLIFNRW